MAPFQIKILPDSILRKKAKPVLALNDAEKETLSRMAETMYLNQGVGLAAVQVGIDKQLAVVDTGDGLIKMANPIIAKREGTQTQEEGCLSVPGASVKVKRADKIKVSFLDENGEVRQLEAEGLLARAIQHEIDHLQGKLIIDYLDPVRKAFIAATFRKTRKNKGRLDKA